MREERVLLEEVADPSVLGRDVVSPLGVEQHGLADVTRPDSGRSRPATTRRVVVLPAPEGPTSASVSPCETVSSADATKERRG